MKNNSGKTEKKNPQYFYNFLTIISVVGHG